MMSRPRLRSSVLIERDSDGRDRILCWRFARPSTHMLTERDLAVRPVTVRAHGHMLTVPAPSIMVASTNRSGHAMLAFVQLLSDATVRTAC